MVPLKIDDTLVGLLHVGELRREERASFSSEKIRPGACYRRSNNSFDSSYKAI